MTPEERDINFVNDRKLLEICHARLEAELKECEAAQSRLYLTWLVESTEMMEVRK